MTLLVNRAFPRSWYPSAIESTIETKILQNRKSQRKVPLPVSCNLTKTNDKHAAYLIEIEILAEKKKVGHHTTLCVTVVQSYM